MAGFGELAAFGTALSWSFSNQIQSAIARVVGPSGVALLRLPYQIALLGCMCLILREDTSLTWQGFWLLTLSGIGGVAYCDFVLYKSVVIVGPTMAVLLQSLSAAFTAVFGWVFLQEVLPLQASLGIVLTLVGVAWVVTERGGSVLLPWQEVPCGKTLAMGIFYGFSCGVVLSVSFIFLRMAMQTGVQPLWATLVRVFMGAVVLWALGCVRGWSGAAIKDLKAHPRLYWMLLISTSCGAGGMWLSSVALKLAPAGVVATLIGLQPITVALVGAVWYRRCPSLRVALGSLIAFGGSALVCLR